MRILAADTSTKVTSIALLEGCTAKANFHTAHSKSQGSSLVPIAKKMLDEINWDIRTIGLFCVGLGPGSFTGLRACLAAMRSFSIALARPLVGISSFDVIANNCLQLKRDICVMFDAKQNKVYARFYSQENRPKSGFLLDSVANILSLIKEPTAVAGDAISSYDKYMLENAKGLVSFVPEKLWYPKAEVLAAMALERHEKAETDSPFSLLPLYIYPKECQIKVKI